MKRIAKADLKRGKFAAISGVIDERGPEKLDVKLNSGFEIQCGLRGSKLSGG